jgi:lipopolysaccharide/colanic/teichoic acid biosynthesis glycosyltransferase
MKMPNTASDAHKTRSPDLTVKDLATSDVRCASGLSENFKFVIEWCLSVVLLAFLSPVFLSIGVLILVTSRGPVIYAQARIGRRGRVYRMFKFRTARHELDRKSESYFVGELLRSLHLDELPELINVVRGDMGLTGPRPQRPELLQWIDPVIAPGSWQYTARPGLTVFAKRNSWVRVTPKLPANLKGVPASGRNGMEFKAQQILGQLASGEGVGMGCVERGHEDIGVSFPCR